MDKSLSELIRISNKAGKDFSLTQGAAGNTSVKTADGKFMFVKASGTAMADMNTKRGWRKINLQKAQGIIKDKKLALLPLKKRETAVADRLLAACEDNIKGKFRPSIETNLHVFLDKCVIHLHPLAVGAFVNSKNGKAELDKLFAGEKFPPLWISYANPGYCLAKKTANLNSRYQKKYKRLPQILFLEKHGLFISAPTSAQVLQLVRKVINRCEKKLTCPSVKHIKKPDVKIIRTTKSIIKNAFFEVTGKYLPVHFFYNNIISAFAKKPDTGRLLKAGPLNPNEIIYTNGTAIWLEKIQKNKIVPYFKKQKPPLAFLVKNLGVFVIGSAKSAMVVEQVIRGSLFIRYNAQRFGGIVALTKPERDFIYNCGA
jgi:rhamnose utilization protein RhaD (predicted bifunctional aldolase and dehydrogenase)